MPTTLLYNGGASRAVDTQTFLFEKRRIVYLTGTIDAVMAENVCSALMTLNEINNERIHLVINSCGGSVSDGFAIIDTMRGIRSPVATVASGLAASMAAVILSAGERGLRYALPHAEIMLHQPFAGTQGTASDVEIGLKRLVHTKENLAAFLSKACDRPTEEILRLIERDAWLDPDQAISFGVLDSVAESITCVFE